MVKDNAIILFARSEGESGWTDSVDGEPVWCGNASTLPFYVRSRRGEGTWDIVGLHAYLYRRKQLREQNPSRNNDRYFATGKLMATYGISSKPIWFTKALEWKRQPDSLSDSQKAAYLAQEYMLMWSTGAVSRYYRYAWGLRSRTLWTPSN